MSATTTTRSGAVGEPAVIDLADAAYWQDPHPILRAAREQHRVAFASTGEPILLRYADVESLAAHPHTISNALAVVERNVDQGPLSNSGQSRLPLCGRRS